MSSFINSNWMESDRYNKNGGASRVNWWCSRMFAHALTSSANKQLWYYMCVYIYICLCIKHCWLMLCKHRWQVISVWPSPFLHESYPSWTWDFIHWKRINHNWEDLFCGRWALWGIQGRVGGTYLPTSFPFSQKSPCERQHFPVQWNAYLESTIANIKEWIKSGRKHNPTRSTEISQAKKLHLWDVT